MTVPKHHEAYHAFLLALHNGKTYRLKEIVDTLTRSMGLTEEQKQETTSSRNNRFYSNLTWTAYNLKKAGLIDRPGYGLYLITDQGLKALEGPGVDEAYVKRLMEDKNDNGTSTPSPADAALADENPSEQLENALAQINDRLADELLDEIMKQTPAFFERLVVELLIRMGYGGLVEGAGQVVGRSGDGGIDGIIKEDQLGFDLIHIQAKHWNPSGTVGRPEVQKFAGALTGIGERKGLFVTTARFTREAEEFARGQHAAKIILVDGPALCRLMIEHNVGVATESTYCVKRLDVDFFINM